MARMLHWIGLAALGITLTGCVSADQYKALKLERDNLAERLTAAERSEGEEKSAADAYKHQLDAIAQNGAAKDGLNTNLNAQLAAQQAAYEELNRKYEDAIQRAAQNPGGQALPQPLTNTLTQFAQQNPDLVDFDSARGIIKFKSDVTFPSGDATITSKAKEVISRFASILNSPGAAQYELMVAGHTDNTPVHNPATIHAGNKDNWYLSAHRAISVATALEEDGVNQSRIGVTGYAEFRPIASNASESGKAQNRRVEVLILPNAIHTGARMASERQTPSKPARANASRYNKDSDGVSSNRSYNK